MRDHVRPLLDLAAAHIPTDRHSETVLYMLATAGMRMLPLSDQNAILTHLRQAVPTLSNFVFSDSHAAIITGKEEGIYAWISANYVLNRLKVTLSKKIRRWIIEQKGVFRLINLASEIQRLAWLIWAEGRFKSRLKLATRPE